MLLEATRLSAGYGPATVVHEVDMALPAGAVHAVVGHNGAGKTTLLHTLAGILPATSGRVALAGRAITTLPPHRRARAGLRLVPQGRRVFASLTVAEHLTLPRPSRPPRDEPPRGRPWRSVGQLSLPWRQQTHNGSPTVRAVPGVPAAPAQRWDRERVLALLPQLGARLRHRGGQLSGGEQQMLAIARALLGQPRVLLLDEPTEGLAPALVDQIRGLLGTLAETGLTILLAAPHPELALAVADRITVLTAGRVTAELSGDDARADPGRLTAALAPAAVPGPAGAPRATIPRQRAPEPPRQAAVEQPKGQPDRAPGHRPQARESSHLIPTGPEE